MIKMGESKKKINFFFDATPASATFIWIMFNMQKSYQVSEN